MFTRRHQALLATLAGMTLGVAAFGAVLAINRNPSADGSVKTTGTPSTTTPKPSATDGTLAAPQPDALPYTRQTVKKGYTWLIADVPANWVLTPQGSYKDRFADSTNTQMIRFDLAASERSPDQQSRLRATSVGKSRDLRIVSRDAGSQAVDWNPGDLTHSTLIYTYTDESRRHRMVLSRWLSVDGGKRSAVEITVAGRPQDETNLRAILDHATETLELARA